VPPRCARATCPKLNASQQRAQTALTTSTPHRAGHYSSAARTSPDPLACGQIRGVGKMNLPDPVQAFRQLKTSRLRSDALDALIAELNPYEWRHVQAKLNAHDFRFDIMGALPVELVALVLAHLDVSAPYRLQTVRRHRHLGPPLLFTANNYSIRSPRPGRSSCVPLTC